MTAKLTTTPLTEPISAADVRRFRHDATAAGQAERPSVLAVIMLIVYAVLALALSVGMGYGVIDTLAGPTERTDWTLAVVGSIMIVGFTWFGLFLLCTAKHELFNKNAWEQWLRLERFAAANSLRYEKLAARPAFPGTIFQHGYSRHIREHLFVPHTHSPDIGNYRYTTGSGRGKAVHEWGYVAVRLARRLPHIVLDATANNAVRSNLPTTFARDQRLSPEGDFDAHFTLYCPAKYERDALYILTPDLMGLLIDEANTFDVEIVDDWMFLYSSRSLDLANPAIVTRLYRIIDTLGVKLRDLSSRVTSPSGSCCSSAPDPSHCSSSTGDLAACR